MAPYASNSICLSQPCIQTASTIFSRFSPDFQKIDPCTNFEEMVCGGLRENNVIAPWESSYSEPTILADANYILMKNILETPSNRSWGSPADDKNFEKLVAEYNSCMNETAISERGVEPLVAFLGNITENFPVSAAEYKSSKPLEAQDHKSFAQTYLWLAQHSIFPFLGMDPNLDPFDPDTFIPTVAPKGPQYTSALYDDEELRPEYEAMVEKVFANILPTNETRAAAKDLARGLVELEGKIASASPNYDVFDLIRIQTLDNVTQSVPPEFDLPSVLKALSPLPLNRTSYPFPEYSAFLSETLANTTKPAIQAYFLWQTIQKFKKSVEGPEIQPLIEFRNQVDGKDASFTQERWRTCMADVDSKMGWLLSKPYVEIKYTDALKKALEEMTTRVQSKLASNIAQIEWMTAKVKEIAKQKVEAITHNLGYPTASPNVSEAQSLSDYYASFDTSGSYFDNSVSYFKWLSQTNGALIGTKQKPGSWPQGQTSALTINAFYYPQDNSMTIIAGILQPMVLDPEVPAYMNYGALGTIIGHEFTHSLDTNGRHFNSKGALDNWWDAESEKGFAERTQCLIEQYGGDNVTFSDGSQAAVNGTLTLSENIADTGGINTAWDAWLDKRREDPASDFDLPGLSDKFTHEQLFYISAAQFFCSKDSDAALQRDLSDVHSPPSVRIKSMMENSRGFREAFNCPVKEPTCVIY
ncbi:Metalloprotease [Hypoxylon sp. FL0543]|nr:Metalloprotease [Hypoxylon sp. FL0543]